MCLQKVNISDDRKEAEKNLVAVKDILRRRNNQINKKATAHSRDSSVNDKKILKIKKPFHARMQSLKLTNIESFLISRTASEREKIIDYNKMCKFLYTMFLDYKVYKKTPNTTLNHYDVINTIGKGSFGKVYLAMHKLTNRYAAIKIFEKENITSEFAKHKIVREIHILNKASHKNIIRLIEVFENSTQIFLVTEYADNGDLLQLIKQKGNLCEEEAKPIFRQIVYGLAHLNCRGVLHRDIKLDNVLMNSKGEVKICDFGVSKIIDKNKLINDQCGTPAYLAPEIIANLGYKGFYVDLWSLGILLYAMLTGTIPFKAKSLEKLYEIIKIGKVEYPTKLSREAKELISGLLKFAPRDRLSIPEVLSHPWLGKVKDEKYYMPSKEDFKEELTNEIDRVCIENLFHNTKVKLFLKDYLHIKGEEQELGNCLNMSNRCEHS